LRKIRFAVFLIIPLTVILIGDNFRLSPGAYEFYSLSKTAYSNTIEDSETEANIVVMLNNEQLTLEQKPVFNGNEIFVPLFPIFEGLDAAIFYHKDNGSIICLTRDGNYIKHQAGTNIIEMNFEKTSLESSSMILDQQIFIPTNFISKIFPDCTLHLQNDQTINILKPAYDYDNEYTKIAEEILEYKTEPYFNPELYIEYLEHKTNNRDMSSEQVIIDVNMGLNKPFYSNVKIIDMPYDQLVLCNKYNKLPDDFIPSNLVQVPDGYYVNDGKDYRIDATVMSCFKSMADDAKKLGVSLKIISGYRSNNYQANLYKSSAARNGKEHADKYVARPGHSEHETGLAIDINSVSRSFENTKSFRWLQDNAHLYGFILRYPKGKEHITGFGYEPWHYRFVGAQAANEIKEMDITFDEYCAKYLSQTDYIVLTSSTLAKI